MSLGKGWENANIQNNFLINSCCLLVSDVILLLRLPINKIVAILTINVGENFCGKSVANFY